MRAEQLTDPIAYHAEGPMWFAQEGVVRFVDMLAGDVLTVGRDGGVTRTPSGSPVAAAMRPRRDGGVAVVREDDVVLYDDRLQHPKPLVRLFADERMRCNEAGVDPQGRLYVGTMRYDREPGAAVMYRVDAAGSATVVMRGLTISNGLCWTPDGSAAYYNDSATGRTDVMDYDGDRLGDRRLLARAPAGCAPDGLTLDADGGVWVALNGGARVVRYDERGRVSETIELPVRQVTSCIFGGGDLGTLYITTSRENLPDGEDAQAGSLWTARPGVTGLPPAAYGG